MKNNEIPRGQRIFALAQSCTLLEKPSADDQLVGMLLGMGSCSKEVNEREK